MQLTDDEKLKIFPFARHFETPTLLCSSGFNHRERERETGNDNPIWLPARRSYESNNITGRYVLLTKLMTSKRSRSLVNTSAEGHSSLKRPCFDSSDRNADTSNESQLGEVTHFENH